MFECVLCAPLTCVLRVRVCALQINCGPASTKQSLPLAFVKMIKKITGMCKNVALEAGPLAGLQKLVLI